MESPPTSTWIGLDITQDFGPRLKSQPPKVTSMSNVQGWPGRYEITCSLFQKCFIIHRQCWTCLVEVLRYWITSHINLDWVRYYPGFLAQIETSVPWRLHLWPRVPRKVWNYLLTVPEVIYNTRWMPDSDTHKMPHRCNWGLDIWNNPQRQPWLG